MAKLHPLLARAERIGLSASYQQFSRLSLTAQEIYSHVATWVPAHLQTKEYALAGHRARQESTGWTQAEMQRLAVYRVALGKAVLSNPLQRRDWYIGQSALMQRIGGAEVMHTQLDRLIELAGSDARGENIRVVPFGTDAHLGMDGTFEVYHHDRDGAVLHEVGFNSDTFDAHPHAVRRGALAFAGLNRTALSTDDSVALMKEIAHEL